MLFALNEMARCFVIDRVKCTTIRPRNGPFVYVAHSRLRAERRIDIESCAHAFDRVSWSALLFHSRELIK